MNQEECWLVRYNAVMVFMECEHHKLSKYYPKEKLMSHNIHPNGKLYNVETMKEKRNVLFEKLLALCEESNIVNQYM